MGMPNTAGPRWGVKLCEIGIEVSECWGTGGLEGQIKRGGDSCVQVSPLQLRSGCLTLDLQEHTALKGHAPLPLPSNGSPAWKSMPTAREVPDTGTRASDLSFGSRGIPRIPSCTEYRRKEPTPETRIFQAWASLTPL